MLIDAAGRKEQREGSKTSARRVGWWVVVAVGFCFALLSGLQMQRNQHGVDDFDQFYVGSKLVFSGHLYDRGAQAEWQRRTVGVERAEVSSSRLPFYYAMLWPLARLPYSTARAVWFGLMICCAAGLVWVWPAKDRGMVGAAVLVSLPLFAATFGQRQDVALMLLVQAAGLRLRSRGMEIAAGVVWSLLAIKFNLFLLLPVVFLVRREWRILAGMVSGGVALAGISFWAAGAHWVSEYVAFISNPALFSDPSSKPNLHGVLAGLPQGWEIGASVVVVGLVILAGRGSFEAAFAGGLLGSFLVSNHAYLHDCAVLIPGLVGVLGVGVNKVVEKGDGPLCPLPEGSGRGLFSEANKEIEKGDGPLCPLQEGSDRGLFSEANKDIEKGDSPLCPLQEGPDRGGVVGWGQSRLSPFSMTLVMALLTPFPYFLGPMIAPVREGLAAAVLIGLTLFALAISTARRSPPERSQIHL